MKLIRRINNKLKRERLIRKRKITASELGIEFHEPNYIFKGNFNYESIIVDVGCANDADFSLFMIDKYKSKCYGVDPTRKHASDLKKLESLHSGKFIYFALALSSESGNITFHESDQFTSGSLDSDHLNMKRDSSISYDVQTLTLPDLHKKIGSKVIEFIKLDLEGAEYGLINSLQKNDLLGYDQLFIEFHHHSFEKYRIEDTYRCVKKLESFGFKSFSLDDHNYLFYKDYE